MQFTYDELKNITQAREIIDVFDSGLKYSISTDTRTIKKGDVYLPLKGESFDGELFIEDAIKKGAVGYFSSTAKKFNGAFGLVVNDTKKAYLQLSSFYKKNVNPVTIAITGSSGKTTTKEIFAAIFETNKKTHKSKLNHNNEIGLCQTLLSMPANTEILIVEMGMRGIGEIDLLAKYAQPDFAVITNIGTAHIGRLGSRENIAKAKCEIVNYFDKDGVLITHFDDIYVETLKDFDKKWNVIKKSDFEIIEMSQYSSVFKYKDSIYSLNVGGEYNVLDAILAIETALLVGLKPQEIQNGLDSYKPIEKRFEETVLDNLTIINDSYNANPDSMKAAIKAFVELYSGEKILVLGDMKELGQDEVEYHKEMGVFLNNFENITVYTVGDLAKNISDITIHPAKHFCGNIEVANELKKYQKKITVFLKASNSMNLYKIIEEIKK